MLSKKISIDIISFLIKKKNLSLIQISELMDLPVSEIKKISNPYYKSILDQKHINCFLEKNDIKYWELIYEAVPPEHLTEEIRKKIELCKIVSNRKKRKRK